MGGVWTDVRVSLRLLARDRRFTLAAALAIGLGIAVNTTVFTLIHAATTRELPFDDAQRLLATRSLDARGNSAGVSLPDLVDWRAAASVAAMGASVDGVMNVSEETRPAERFRGTYVSANVFEILRVQPIAGRPFTAADDAPGAPAAVIIGHGVWHNRYGADPAIVGRAVRVNGVSATIVGVMPAGFKYPFLTEVWQPLAQWPGAAGAGRGARTLAVVGRLRDGATLEQARVELETIVRGLAREYPATNTGVSVRVVPLKETRPDLPSGAVTAMVLAAAFVLLIACANLAHLLLARAAGRARDIAIRAAVGATRWRIMRQLLVECAMIASLGGAIGFVLSLYGVARIGRGLEIIEPGAAPGTTRPYWYDFSPDVTVLAFVAALCLISVCAFGLLPAWHLARADAHEMLKQTGRGGGARVRRWTAGLVTAELALTLTLLASAGLIWRSFAHRINADPGFDASRLVTMRLALPPTSYATPDQRRAFWRRLDERLAGVAAVHAASVTSLSPAEFFGAVREISLDLRPRVEGDRLPLVAYVQVGDRYFSTIGLPILRGRPFSAADQRSGVDAAIVDDTLARRFFAGEDPLGRQIRLTIPAAPGRPAPDPASARTLTIVGVARTIPVHAPPDLIRPMVYVPLLAEPAPDSRATVLVKGDLATAVAALRDEVRRIDAHLPLFGIETMDAAVARGRSGIELMGTWFGALALVALVLAAVGLHALTAHAVAQRVHEIGVRVALGATRPQIVTLFVRRLAAPLGIGVALGVFGAFGAGRLLGGYLLGIDPRDPLTIAGVTVFLIVVAALSTLFPARRAARVDPTIALRAE